MVKISFEDIFYVESLSDYVKIYSGTKIYTVREKISAIEEKLPSEKFICTHRSFIVSVAQMESYTHEQIVINGNSIPISRSYKDAVLEKLLKFP